MLPAVPVDKIVGQIKKDLATMLTSGAKEGAHQTLIALVSLERFFGEKLAEVVKEVGKGHVS